MGKATAIALGVLAASAPAASAQEFDGPYPARLLTIESGELHDRGRGVVGLGDARVALVGSRIEILTNTIADAFGVLNAGFKLGVFEARGDRPALALGLKYYHSIGGLIDAGVRRIAESFATVTDSDVDVRGWVAHATATWPVPGERTRVHFTAQLHRPIESRFTVEDDVAGGGGSVRFVDGEDVSALVGIDHALAGRRLILLTEAGVSWGLDRPRLGIGLDAGSENWRVVAGVLLPGVETDLASDPRDFEVTPVFSLHRRF
ncbi:MAG TPA: hypothetical protein VM737_05975 [Gemmatimonadota bacterium]|nr:hypothetical protein [Gemmatimonadota bacterium]